MGGPDITNVLLLGVLVALIWIGRTLSSLEHATRQTCDYLLACGLTDAFGDSRLEMLVKQLNSLITAVEMLDRKQR